MITKTDFMFLLTLGLLLFASAQADPLPGGSLDPTTVPKYVMPLVVPPVMPQARLPENYPSLVGKEIDYYEIAVRQFQQQILPPVDETGADTGIPPTTVWSYTAVGHPETFNYPSFTINAEVNRPVWVKWINGLVDDQGNYLPHLLPVDPTLHWANPPGPIDTRPDFATTPGPYTGPVPIVTHLHEGHTSPENDGHPEAWYLPNANNIPEGYTTHGSHFGQVPDVPVEPGAAVFRYPNDQRAATLWFHDHTLGMTRLNVYAGPAGFYLLRGGPDDLDLDYRAPRAGDQAGSDVVHTEIPVAIQDRSFNADGSLFYPDTRAFFDDITGPFIPFTDVSPIWNPEFFGNTMVVNGRTWPTLNVEPRRYRFRFLDGTDARFVILKIASDPLEPRPARPALPFWQIGTEGGFLPEPVKLDKLLLGPAERADVIIDFTGIEAGTALYLINEGPDEPFGGGQPGVDFTPADPSTTGQVMRFVVVPSTEQDNTTPPEQLVLPPFVPLGPEDRTRQLSLNEILSSSFEDAPVKALLGTVEDGEPAPREWDDPVTERVELNSTEVWELHNFTVDAHPIHVHLVTFQVVNREDMETGEVFPPEPWETGFKDTVIAYPGRITRIKAKFDIAGQYVWHCHILEHEDNEMMRPFIVSPATVPIEPDPIKPGDGNLWPPLTCGTGAMPALAVVPILLLGGGILRRRTSR